MPSALITTTSTTTTTTTTSSSSSRFLLTLPAVTMQLCPQLLLLLRVFF